MARTKQISEGKLRHSRAMLAKRMRAPLTFAEQFTLSGWAALADNPDAAALQDADHRTEVLQRARTDPTLARQLVARAEEGLRNLSTTHWGRDRQRALLSELLLTLAEVCMALLGARHIVRHWQRRDPRTGAARLCGRQRGGKLAAVKWTVRGDQEPGKGWAAWPPASLGQSFGVQQGWDAGGTRCLATHAAAGRRGRLH